MSPPCEPMPPERRAEFREPCPNPHQIPGGPDSPDEATNCRCPGGPASHAVRGNMRDPFIPWQPDVDPAEAAHVVHQSGPHENRLPRADPLGTPYEAAQAKVRHELSVLQDQADRARMAAEAKPPTPLGPGELRALLRECVNVVEPGDVLVIRVPADYRADNLQALHELVEVWLAHNAPGVRALVVPAEEITVFRPAPVVTFAEQSAGTLPPEVVEEVQRRLAEVHHVGWPPPAGDQP